MLSIHGWILTLSLAGSAEWKLTEMVIDFFLSFQLKLMRSPLAILLVSS
jgi:hypothetical protein